MQLEQTQFEEAVEKDKEHIRSWFAANTDKNEFKKKPDYSKNAKPGELGNYKDNKASTPAENKSDAAKSEAKTGAATKSSGAGSSASKSSENGKGSAPATPASDAAAAAAAAAAPAAP